jgi:hypothetical protein
MLFMTDSLISRRKSFRPVVLGAAAIVGGSLAITTVVGVAAIVGMLVAGNNAENIIAQLPSSLALAIFCAAGGLLMSAIGGYSAAIMAGSAAIRHALWAGLLAVPLNLAVLAVLGDPGPAWLTALATVLIVPCAVLGGWLAAPIPTAITAPAPER